MEGLEICELQLPGDSIHVRCGPPELILGVVHVGASECPRMHSEARQGSGHTGQGRHPQPPLLLQC